MTLSSSRSSLTAHKISVELSRRLCVFGTWTEKHSSHAKRLLVYMNVSTTGQSLAAMAQDVLIRLDLPIAFLRGQTYDGAANMSGIHNGCQAIITDKQPLALFVHCGAHCTNLVAQSAACAAPCTQDAMQWLQGLGNFYGASIKYRQPFADVAISQCLPANAIKPLCPTRWLTRTPAIESVLDRYSVVLESLQEAKATDPQSRAAGLLDRFEKGATVLGLMMALRVFSPLERLNKSLHEHEQLQSSTNLPLCAHRIHSMSYLRKQTATLPSWILILSHYHAEGSPLEG